MLPEPLPEPEPEPLPEPEPEPLPEPEPEPLPEPEPEQQHQFSPQTGPGIPEPEPTEHEPLSLHQSEDVLVVQPELPEPEPELLLLPELERLNVVQFLFTVQLPLVETVFVV